MTGVQILGPEAVVCAYWGMSAAASKMAILSETKLEIMSVVMLDETSVFWERALLTNDVALDVLEQGDMGSVDEVVCRVVVDSIACSMPEHLIETHELGYSDDFADSQATSCQVTQLVDIV